RNGAPARCRFRTAERSPCVRSLAYSDCCLREIYIRPSQSPQLGQSQSGQGSRGNEGSPAARRSVQKRSNLSRRWDVNSDYQSFLVTGGGTIAALTLPYRVARC